MAANERYISGMRSNHLYQDGLSNPGFGLYITTERIFGVKEVSFLTHLINPRIFNPLEEDVIKDPIDIGSLEQSSSFSIKKDELETIKLKKPKGSKVLKWTIMGDFAGLGSLTFQLKNGQKYSLLLNNEGYPKIKNYLEKYASRYLDVVE